MENDTLGSKVKVLVGKLIPRNKESNIQWKKPLMAFLMMVILGVSGFLVYENGFSYQVKLNGKDIGFIKDEETLEEALNIVEQDVIEEYGEDAYFNKETGMERVRGHNKEVVELEELRQEILQEVEVLKPASIIVVDGREKIIVESEERAKAILEEVKNSYIEDKEDIEILEVGFTQDVEIITKDVAVDLIVSQKEALLALGTKEGRNKINKVNRGNTRRDISRFSNRDIDELEKLNPEGNNINFSETLLDVVSIERQKSKASIDYKTEEKDDPSIYIGEKKVEREGKKGEKEILTELLYINGIETEREIIGETIIEEPKNKVILVGTKERPEVVKTQRDSKNQIGTTPTKSNESPKHNNNLGSSVVGIARKYLGTPYKYGGNTPEGFDCSGFTSYVYKQCGITIPRTSGGQGSHGANIPRNQLKPGDIVSFPGHVGIYVGGDNFIHSPRPGKNVEVKSLSSYGGTFLSGRRPY